MTDRRAGFRALEDALRSQAERIDDLTRTCASLVDDNRAFRQRQEREKDRVIDAEKARLAQILLETHDGLELAFRASGRDRGPGDPAQVGLREGVRLTLSTLERRISEIGASRLEVLGLPFDPRTAEAIDLVAVADESLDGTVIEELRTGWRIGDRVLRAARVRVGRLARA